MSKTIVLSRLVLLIAPLVGAMPVWGQALPQTPTYATVILAVSVNGLPGDQGVVLLQNPPNQLFAPITLLQDWGLLLAGQGMTAANGLHYMDLASLPGVSFSWDQARTELAISAEPEAFFTTHVNAGDELTAKVAPYTPGVYLNYDASFTDSPGLHERQALVDVGLFQGEGLFTSNFAVGTLGNTRLMSSFQTDQVSAMKTLRVGDSYSSAGAWGRPVLFGGFQFGTNFAIRPHFIPMALPSVSGRALLPSTVDIYVDNTLRTRQNIKAGAFSIQNLPVLTGAGEVQVVVKDLLGREQVLTQPFFASPILLRPGLVEQAFEIGWQRNNYGQASHDYSDPFAALTYRKGLSPRVTAEAHLELQQNMFAAGLSGAASLPTLSSVAEVSAAISHADHFNPGTLLDASYSYLGKRWSGHASVQWQSGSFRQLGSNPDQLTQQSGSVQLNLPLGSGSLSVNYLRHQLVGADLMRIVNLSFSQRLASKLHVSMVMFKPLFPRAGTTLGLTLTLLLDAQHVLSSSLSGGTDTHSAYTTVSRSTPPDGGFGYRLASLNGSDPARQQASLAHNQSNGSFQAELVRQQSDVSARLSAQGGLVLMEDDMYFGRRLDESFAVVKVAGVAKIPIYLENQVAANTNARGRAVVGPLRAYQDNNISLDPLTLRMDTAVNAVKHTVVPRSQGGVLVDFHARQMRRVTLTVLDLAGSELPPWTAVEVRGVAQNFVIGHRGEVFVELPQPGANLAMAWLPDGSRCQFTIDVPVGTPNLSFLKPITCLPAE